MQRLQFVVLLSRDPELQSSTTYLGNVGMNRQCSQYNIPPRCLGLHQYWLRLALKSWHKRTIQDISSRMVPFWWEGFILRLILEVENTANMTVETHL